MKIEFVEHFFEELKNRYCNLICNRINFYVLNYIHTNNNLGG